MKNKTFDDFEQQFGMMHDSHQEYVSWLEKEIAKEDVRANDGDTKTGIRRWVLSIMKNAALSNAEIVSDKQNS